MKVPKALSYLQVLITSYCIDVDNFEVFLALDIDRLSITLLKDCFKLDIGLIKDILCPHLHLMSEISSRGLMISINSPSIITLIVFYLSKFGICSLLLELYSYTIFTLFVICPLAY